MPFIPSFSAPYVDGQVLFAAALNGDFGLLRTNVNAYCAFIDENASITGTWTFTTSPVFADGLTLGDTLTVSSGGFVVSAGGAAITGNSTITGTLNVSGALTAASFSGAGGSLTALNASQLTSGTIPDARFPATLPAVNGSNLTNLTGANVTGLTAAQIAVGTYPSGAFTYPGTVTAGGVISTGLDRGTRTTGSASSGTYAIPVTTNHHRVTINHSSPVTLEWPTGTTGEPFVLEVLQGTGTPQSYSFGGSGMTIVWSNGGGPLPTLTANRKDVYGAIRTASGELLMWQIMQNVASTT
jgi:hypothetical protein